MMRLFALLLPALLLVPVAVPADANLLRASSKSQTAQNQQANEDDLSRMSNAAMVRRFAEAGLLARVPSVADHYYTRYIPTKYSYVRPWSKLFLDRLSSQFYARFKKKLRVTSLVRTVALQQSLSKRNGNAASAYGEKRSTHLTGATLDISKNGMTGAEIVWMRQVLHSVMEQGYLYAVEEFNQPAFHIMVYRDYPDYVARLNKRSGEEVSD